MVVTKETLVHMLTDYINGKIDVANLICWAEEMMRDADFEDRHFELLRDITARIGLADVREFGLYWDDCCNYLQKLGYRVRIEISQIP